MIGGSHSCLSCGATFPTLAATTAHLGACPATITLIDEPGVLFTWGPMTLSTWNRQAFASAPTDSEGEE